MATSNTGLVVARHPDNGTLTVITIDNVSIVVEKDVLLHNSTNKFDGKLADSLAQGPIYVTESSQVFDLFLDVLLDREPVRHEPAPAIISDLLACLTKYGVPLDDKFSQQQQQKPFYNFVLTSAISYPLDTFALVCKYHLEDLAVECARHLLSIPLTQITEEQSLDIGPVYLRRLTILHLKHAEGLKQLLAHLPDRHESNEGCDDTSQKNNLERLWNNAVKEIWAEGEVSTITTSELQSRLGPLANQLQCGECQARMRQRVQRLIVEWSTAVFAEL
ncbi:hypothetical protein FRC17_001201 [Serendipita sp. 399]|nr:hypothetical protein FRC17_001201 [Serendipita sp. 399]